MKRPALDIKDVIDLQVDGVVPNDYPDFCDAYFSYGVWKATGYAVSEEDLVELTENNGEVLNEMAFQSLI